TRSWRVCVRWPSRCWPAAGTSAPGCTSCCGGTNVDADRTGLALDWPTFTRLATGLAADIARDGPPQVLVGVLRGGMVPTVMLAHALGLRAVRAVEVTHTTTDDIDAAKTEAPVVV